MRTAIEYKIELLGGPHDGQTYDLMRSGRKSSAEARPRTFYVSREDREIVCTEAALKGWLGGEAATYFWVYRCIGRLTSNGRRVYEFQKR